jgi:PBP1b-binding outer membrane lipoprotein LpoB
MTRMSALAVAFGLALSLGACSSDADKQWYKPAGNYSTAEFDRDSRACTKNRQLDEECLKQRGWVSLSGDIVRKVQEKPPAGASNRY